MHSGVFIRIFLIILAIGFLLDWYAYNGLRTLSSGGKWRSWRRWITGGYLVVAIGIPVVFVAQIGTFRTANGMIPFHEWMLSLFLTLFISKIFFVLVLF